MGSNSSLPANRQRPAKNSLRRFEDEQFVDIDLSFGKTPSGDISVREGIDAIRGAIENLLLLDVYDKPFQTNGFGVLNGGLFELDDVNSSIFLGVKVRALLERFEPRIVIRAGDVRVRVNRDEGIVDIDIIYRFNDTDEVKKLDVTLNIRQ
jgi:predicted component of type VI protein secretion system